MHDMTLWLFLADALLVVAIVACRSTVRASLVPVRILPQLAQLEQHRSRQSIAPAEGNAMTSPLELARAYDQYAAALWRGEEAEAKNFADWLEEYWADEGPAELADHPYVVSVLGGAGAGIRWYVRGGTVVGYVGCRAQGCFQVPMDSAPPPVPLRDDRPRCDRSNEPVSSCWRSVDSRSGGTTPAPDGGGSPRNGGI